MKLTPSPREPAVLLYQFRGPSKRQNNTMAVLMILLHMHDLRWHQWYSSILNSLVVDTLPYSGWAVVVVLIVDRNVCNILFISSGYWSITA